MDGETLGQLLALAIWALVLWGAFGRGSLARAIRDVVAPGRDDREEG